MTKQADVKKVFAETVKAFGRVDFLFNNAGKGLPAGPMEDIKLEDWQGVVDLNLTAASCARRRPSAQFKAQSPQGGRIVNNGSISAHTPRPMSVAYTATKHAITGLTKCIALDGRPTSPAASSTSAMPTPQWAVA